MQLTTSVRKFMVAIPAIAAVSLMSSGCAQSPCCASYPNRAFEAVYELTAPNGEKVKQVWLSNGKGKIRIESVGRPENADHATIVDYVSRTALSIIPEQSVAVAQPVARPWISHGTEEQEHAEDLGERQIDGHKCHGWKVTKDGAPTEFWLGEDTGCYVQINGADAHSGSFKLVDYKAANPDPSRFELPPGYKIMKMPGFPMQTKVGP